MDINDQTNFVPDASIDASKPDLSRNSYFGWLKSTISQSADIWNHIKRDISEVAQSVTSSEPVCTARGTAASVYRQLSDAVHGFQQEGAQAQPPPSDSVSSSIEDDGNFGAHLATIKSSFSGIVTALEKGISELTGAPFTFTSGAFETDTSCDNREARIEVIRADPNTYEHPPKDQKDILPYSEWRRNFFDHHACCPYPNIPVFEGTTLPSVPSATATTATYLSPSQVLEESTTVRNNLLRIVDPDSEGADLNKSHQGGEVSVTEADFWSRYYYCVWRLDVLELRRARLAATTIRTGTVKTPEEEKVGIWPGLGLEEDGDGRDAEMTLGADSMEKSELPRNMALPSHESQLPSYLSTECLSPAGSVVLVTKDEVAEEEENDVDVEKENFIQQSSLETTEESSREGRENEEVIHLSAECFHEEDAKSKAEPLSSDGDEASEAGSDWEKWS